MRNVAGTFKMLWQSWKAMGGQIMRYSSTAILTRSLKAQVSVNNAWSVVSQYNYVSEGAAEIKQDWMERGLVVSYRFPFLTSLSLESISQKQPTQFKTPKAFTTENVVGGCPLSQHPFS